MYKSLSEGRHFMFTLAATPFAATVANRVGYPIVPIVDEKGDVSFLETNERLTSTAHRAFQIKKNETRYEVEYIEPFTMNRVITELVHDADIVKYLTTSNEILDAAKYNLMITGVSVLYRVPDAETPEVLLQATKEEVEAICAYNSKNGFPCSYLELDPKQEEWFRQRHPLDRLDRRVTKGDPAKEHYYALSRATEIRGYKQFLGSAVWARLESAFESYLADCELRKIGGEEFIKLGRRLHRLLVLEDGEGGFPIGNLLAARFGMLISSPYAVLVYSACQQEARFELEPELNPYGTQLANVIDKIYQDHKAELDVVMVKALYDRMPKGW